MNHLSFQNEQLMMEQADGPMSIRQLAEQTYLMQQEDHKEHAQRRQHDTVLFKRSMDPTVSHNRKKEPIHKLTRMTKDGLIGGKGISIQLAKEDEDVPQEEKQEESSEETSTEEETFPVGWLVTGFAGVGLIVLAIYLFFFSE